MAKVNQTLQSVDVMERYTDPPAPVVENKQMQDDSPLLILPIEILEMILQYLDGRSLASLSKTCSLFYNLVNEVAEWQIHLFSLCQKSPNVKRLGIPFGIPLWRLFSGNWHQKCFNSDLPWKQIYYCTQMWRGVRKWNYSLFFSTSAGKDEIKSVVIAGQTIVLGSQKGEVSVWYPDRDELSLMKIHLCPAEVDDIFVLMSEGQEDVHYRIIIHCVDTTLSIFDMTGYLMLNGVSKRRDLKKMSCHGDYLFEWDPDTGSNARTLIEDNFVKRCCEFQRGALFDYGPFVAVDLEERLFISRTKGPLFVNFDGKEPGVISCHQFVKCDGVVCIFKGYIWPGQITFSLCSNGTTIITVGKKFKVVKWPPILKCTSASLFANVLLIGTNIGQILVFSYNDPADILEFDPLKFQKKLYISNRECIIYVGVRVQNQTHMFPDIIAATKSKLFCFRASGIVGLS